MSGPESRGARPFPGGAAPATEPDLLRGRVALVTGGSAGIGLACAREAVAAGARVLIAARGREGLDAAAAELREARAGVEVEAVTADVADAAAAENLADTALGRFGRLDGVVHAAGVLGPIGPATELDLDEWWASVRTNLLGSFAVARAAARRMRRGGGGRIVLLSGGGATSPLPSYTAYACAKAAVVRLAETLAVELAPDGIEVNVLAPGFVATRIHEATLAAGERAGGDYLAYTRENLASGGVPAWLPARAAVFLLSDRARGITGRLVSAPWDEWWTWPARLPEIRGGDLFTLRRIVPADRGLDWG